jgi:hypothetical protein
VAFRLNLVEKMNVTVYRLVIAYGFLLVSVLTFAIDVLITVLAFIEVFFRVNFGYQPWSVAAGIALSALGYGLIKASLCYLKRLKRQDL